MNTAVASVSWGSGRLDIFGVGSDDRVYWKFWDDAKGWQPAFPVWQQVPGDLTFCSAPAAVSRGPGLLDIFALRLSDRVMMHNQWINGWSGWFAVNGPAAASPTAVVAGPDDMAAFAIGDEGGLFWNRWNAVTHWGPPLSVPSGGLTFVGQPAAVYSSNTYHLFALATDLNIYFSSWIGEYAWTPWQSVPKAVFDSVPVAIASAGGRMDVFAMDANNAIAHNSIVNGAWGGWHSLGGVLNSIPAAVWLGDDRMDLFALGADNSMQHLTLGQSPTPGWVPLGGVFNCPPTAVSWGPNRLDVFALGTLNEVEHRASPDAVHWPNLWDHLGGVFHIPNVRPAPSPGLTSNYNYKFQNSCEPLLGVTVAIDITEDMIVASDTLGTDHFAGCSFQLNAYSPLGAPDNFQQYVFLLNGKQISGTVNCWAGDPNQPLIALARTIMPDPSQQLAKGLRLTIKLQNDPSGQVTGVTFTVAKNGQPVASQFIGMPESYIASIVAFQLNIVGPASGEMATFSSGAGTITYSITGGRMVAGSTVPPCGQGMNIITEETANIRYGALDAYPDCTFLQLFGHS